MIVTLDPYLTTLICHAMHFFTVISNGYVTAHHFTIYRIVASFYFDSLQSKTKDAYVVHGVKGIRRHQIFLGGSSENFWRDSGAQKGVPKFFACAGLFLSWRH